MVELTGGTTGRARQAHMGPKYQARTPTRILIGLGNPLDQSMSEIAFSDYTVEGQVTIGPGVKLERVVLDTVASPVFLAGYGASLGCRDRDALAHVGGRFVASRPLLGSV